MLNPPHTTMLGFRGMVNRLKHEKGVSIANASGLTACLKIRIWGNAVWRNKTVRGLWILLDYFIILCRIVVININLLCKYESWVVVEVSEPVCVPRHCCSTMTC